MPPPRKPRYIRKRRYKRKRLVRRGRKYNHVFVKLRYQIDLGTNVAGVMAESFSCTNPTTAVTGAGTYQEWGSITQLYDLYRPTGLKVQFIPFYPNNLTATTAYAPLFVVHDIDNSTLLAANRDQMIEYSNCKIHNLYRPWKQYFKVPRVTNQQKTVGPYLTVGTPINVGCIGIYGDGLSLSSMYGTFILTMYMKCLARR